MPEITGSPAAQPPFQMQGGETVMRLWLWNKTKRLHGILVVLSLGHMVFAGSIIAFSLASRGMIDGAVSMDRGQLVHFSGMLLGIVLLQLALRLFLNSVQEMIRFRMIRDLRADILGGFMGKDYGAISAYHSGEIINRLFSDVQAVADGASGMIPPFVNFVTRIAGASAVLVALDPGFAVLFLTGSLILFLTVRFFKERMKNLHRDVQQKEGRVHAVMQEILENIRIIKVSEAENRMFDRAVGFLKDQYRAQMRRRACGVAAGAGMSFVFRMGYFFALLWGCRGIFERTMSYGTLMAILQLIGQIQYPFAEMSGLLQKLYAMQSSAERLAELEQLPDEKTAGEESADGRALYEQLERIELINVSFSYGKNPVLQHVNLKLVPGTFTAVTGLSGAGKSTLFLLLLGIYQPTEGEIRFVMRDGSLKHPGKDTRRLFAYVPQGNALFSGTIRENIAFFRDGAESRQVEEAAACACVTEFLSELPQGLDTPIGENGFGLSEGQAQRVAVARAVLSEAPILLLDEATSALDEETEGRLLQHISLLKGRGCLIVTHRKAALSICGAWLRIEDGFIRPVSREKEE